MDKPTKDNLFHGSHNERWYNAELTEKPKDIIKTPFGDALLTVNDDYSISIDVLELRTIWGVTYKIKGTIRLNTQTESWWFSNHTMRAKKTTKTYLGQDWESLTPSTPTDKASKKVRDTLSPLLEQWAEKNWQQLGNGKNIGHLNLIEQARAKISDLRKQLEMREQWLDEVEREFKKTGQIPDADMRNEQFNLYGRYWRFD